MEGFTPPRGINSSSFRESDVELLQKGAREWLEAVLEVKLDPDASLQDLLADGTVLFNVSQIVKKNLEKLSFSKGHIENPPAPSLSSPHVNLKTSLKYQPYSYVEAFLKVCKDVGMLDLDLFNPSDAVDKKDIRHVCVCLRSLSKKARMLSIQLPDFDNVRHTWVSPSPKQSTSTEVVNNLRDHIEQPSNKLPSARLSMSSKLSKDGSSSTSVDPPSRGASDADCVNTKLFQVGSQAVETPYETAEIRQPSSMELIESNAKQAVPEVETTALMSDERDLRPISPSVISKEPQVNGLGVLDLSCKDLSFMKSQGLERNELKKRGKSNNRYSWFPYVTGVVMFVGAIVLMVVDRERTSSQLVHEAQPADTLAEISRRTEKSSWQDIMRNNTDIHDPNITHPNVPRKL
ncbi:uncharacterized protein [Physcomitrium patens]|uniref:Calponin-homology (CH) domain-containing protein n=1 Tax=Physcomitrium patens TaxID=3218 RepID=A0A2K1KE50_PHYPA|nr:uncharacterized protein LOC112283461 [Physcomitrium patens]XP_024377899.1 uncharacterized protein LOC112283461 [Physcomitrium patens]XP_024377900.1 uncharacterized protein LOC112283461 [Physcomitrium patens]XP_024377901.1 uncharacterized protein LOC112283461 [Physcomitrium patens]XP_024377902.1 uncharacterized protein LOC112283461 [Physcomitrium patens]XP_024377903.1 uncharacterized protein LOC112283461 [Physcomitrium patens]XP_024377904.1 uncharacterized protein LOC112283461 [Physcomitriu|eukprot:XP_024377898.1 uncharacterized protein LOC112283461 [Physcomitrella patens]